VLEVARCCNQDHRLLLGYVPEPGQRRRCGVAAELGAIAAGEFLEPGGIVPVPAAQVRSRGDVFHPLVEGRILFADASWPESVYQNAVAILSRVFVIDAPELER
jgi:hypothetical protein